MSTGKPSTEPQKWQREHEVRDLTPEEIGDLRRDKEETGLWLMQEFSKMPRLLTAEELDAINGSTR